MNNPAIKEAVDFENRFFATDEMKRRYELSEKHRHDYMSSIDYAHMQGKSEGIAEGAREKALKTAQNLLQIGLDIQTIAKSVELPVEEIENLRKNKS